MSSPEGDWTVRRLLEWTAPFFQRKGIDSPRLCAELLLAHVLGIARIKLYTDYQRVPAPAELDRYRKLVQRAAENEPIAYLTGKGYFFNLELDVTRDVLIPRPDTETLVEHVIQLSRHQAGLQSPRVLDLCTGSGCIAAAIAQNLKTATVIAIDISAPAAEVARNNIRKLALTDRVTVEQGDLYEPLERGGPDRAPVQPFDLVVSNPPYIATAQWEKLESSVRDFEPRLALDGGADGLDIHRRILGEMDQRLIPGGHVFLEIAFDQGEAALAMMGEYPGFESVRILKDHGGKDRVVTGRRK